VAAERHIERAVRVVTGERKAAPSVRPRIAGVASGYELAVALHHDLVGKVTAPSKAGRHSPIAAKGRIETAVGVVASEREICVQRIPRSSSGDDDLAVGL